MGSLSCWLPAPLAAGGLLCSPQNLLQQATGCLQNGLLLVHAQASLLTEQAPLVWRQGILCWGQTLQAQHQTPTFG